MKKIECGACHQEFDLSEVRIHNAESLNFCKCPHCGATNTIASESKDTEDKPSKIYEYPCGIYPRMVWVTFDCPKEVLDDLFEDPIEDIKDNDAINAFVTHNRRIKPEVKGGVLMLFKKDKVTPEIVAHEAVHAAMFICQYCGMEVSCDDGYQEYFAYLVGWVVECVYKALKQDGDKI